MTKEQLEALAHFLPMLESPDFSPGKVRASGVVEPDILTMPYVDYSEPVLDLEKALYEHCWILPGSDWSGWLHSSEAESMRDDPSALAAATPEQLARLLTVVVRQERFVEGALFEPFESGLILRIVRRAAAIIDTGTA